LGACSLAAALAAPASAGTPDACGLLTEAEASAVVGKPAKATPGTFNMFGPSCMWIGEGRKLSVRLETDETLAALTKQGPKQTATQRFAAMRDEIKPKKAVAVSGIGEDAVWHLEFSQLWVLKNKKVAVISIMRGFSFEKDLERAKAAAIKVAAKL
jgi:hypothetical protein